LIRSYGATPYEELKAQEVQRKVRDGLRLPKRYVCLRGKNAFFGRIFFEWWLTKLRPRFFSHEQ
jgi:hypothetical protein